jgi:hypothetical protein
MVTTITRDGRVGSGYPLTISAESGIRADIRGYPPSYWLTLARGIFFFTKNKKRKRTGPPRPREERPRRREESLPASWCSVYIPARREGFLPASWISNQVVRRSPTPSRREHQLVGRNPFRQAGLCTSSPGGNPPDELVYNPARREEPLPTSISEVPIPIIGKRTQTVI